MNNSFISKHLGSYRILYLSLGIFLSFLGAKWHVVQQHASPTHHFDPWAADALQGIIPYYSDDYEWADMLTAPNNEHRIGLTRFWSILLTKINGQWDNKFKATINAVVHSLFYILLFILFRRYLDKIYTIIIPAAFIVISFSHKSWENTVSSFQIQFYLSLINGFLCIYFFSKGKHLANYFVGTLFYLLSIFSISSTIFSVFPLIVLSLKINFYDKNKTKKEVIKLFYFLSLFIIAFLSINFVPENQKLRADSLSDFISYFFSVFSFPFESRNLFLNIFFSAILNFPVLYFVTYTYWKKRNEKNRNDDLLFLCAIWMLTQIAALSYARGNSLLIPSRYFDFSAVLALLNVYALCKIQEIRTLKQVFSGTTISFFWLLTLSLGIASSSRNTTLMPYNFLSEKFDQYLQKYSIDRNASAYRQTPKRYVPYPSPEPVLSVMNNAVMQDLLPHTIQKPLLLLDQNNSYAKQKLDTYLYKEKRVEKFYLVDSNSSRGFKSKWIPTDEITDILKLKFKVSPSLPTSSLKMIDDQGNETFLKIEKFKGAWQSAHFFVPSSSKRIQIVASTNISNSSIKFQDPTQVTFPSWLFSQIRKLSDKIMLSGIFCTFFTLLMLKYPIRKMK